MKSMLIIASFIAVAVAGPVQRALVAPGMPGPTPIVEDISSPIAVGPAIIDGFLPVNPVIDVPAADGTPLVQIILNINAPSAEVIAPTPIDTPVVPEVVLPGPVNVVEGVEMIVPEPVVIGTPALPEVVVPTPVVIGTPALPEVVVPTPVVIGTPALPEVVVPEPVIVGTPIIPAPAVVLPDILN